MKVSIVVRAYQDILGPSSKRVIATTNYGNVTINIIIIILYSISKLAIKSFTAETSLMTNDSLFYEVIIQFDCQFDKILETVTFVAGENNIMYNAKNSSMVNNTIISKLCLKSQGAPSRIRCVGHSSGTKFVRQLILQGKH